MARRFQVLGPLLAVVAAIAADTPPVVAASRDGSVECDRDLRVEFVTPADWLCATKRGCVTCNNIAAHSSLVRMRGPGGEWQDYEIEAAAALEMCAGLET